jgi:hypothetical protein
MTAPKHSQKNCLEKSLGLHYNASGDPDVHFMRLRGPFLPKNRYFSPRVEKVGLALTLRLASLHNNLVMSDNTNLSANFSPEEWTLLKSAPLLAGLSVTLSDLRSGIFGAIKEESHRPRPFLKRGPDLRIPSSPQ